MAVFSANEIRTFNNILSRKDLPMDLPAMEEVVCEMVMTVEAAGIFLLIFFKI